MPANDPRYQREYMAKRRAKTAKSSPTNDSSEGASGDPSQPAGPVRLDRGGEHYWLRKLGDDFVTCVEFNFQGRMVGGCGEVRPYTGKLISTRLDGQPDLAKVISDSDQYKEIQAKMPVTKDRFGR